MPALSKRILILDEHGFSRVCSAILEEEGYSTDTIVNSNRVAAGLNNNEFGLIVTSYPYGISFMNILMNKKIPTIILSDQVNNDLMSILERCDNTHCMIKPLDFNKFKCMVKDIMNGSENGKRRVTIV